MIAHAMRQNVFFCGNLPNTAAKLKVWNKLIHACSAQITLLLSLTDRIANARLLGECIINTRLNCSRELANVGSHIDIHAAEVQARAFKIDV